MTAISKPAMTTLKALDAAMEAAQQSGARPYLGMSQIGHSCERHLFYSFRWAAKRHIPAQGLRAIEDGFLGEEVMAKRLRMIPGIELHTTDEFGGQIGVEDIRGHFRGHLDGAILGVVEAPKTWHVWEHKQVNPEKFKKLQKLISEHGEKAALAKWDGVYFAQAQSYMGLTSMERHFLTVGTPGGREYVTVRTEFDQVEFTRLVERARRIITSSTPPTRLSADPAWHECKFCPFHAQCHGEQLPEVNCRTCAHSTPRVDVEGGVWQCELEHMVVDLPTQRQGCNGHRYIPILLERVAEQVDARDEAGGNLAVEYRLPNGTTFLNGYPPGFSSTEIRASKHASMLGDSQVQAIKAEFPQARVTA